MIYSIGMEQNGCVESIYSDSVNSLYVMVISQ